MCRQSQCCRSEATLLKYTIFRISKKKYEKIRTQPSETTIFYHPVSLSCGNTEQWEYEYGNLLFRGVAYFNYHMQEPGCCNGMANSTICIRGPLMPLVA